jgi:hypothetical protein
VQIFFADDDLHVKIQGGPEVEQIAADDDEIVTAAFAVSQSNCRNA